MNGSIKDFSGDIE
jgi:hypothetical protein